jgi:serine/threonine protein kinase
MRGHYSIKSDVFSFGVLILEIVTGRRNGGSYSSDDSSTDLLSLVSTLSLPNSIIYTRSVLNFLLLSQLF